MNTRRHLTIVAVGLLLLSTRAHATGWNAWHFDATGYRDATLVGGNTIYTPRLDLAVGPEPNPLLLGNLLQNKSLDEIFLKITFKAGVTPAISKLAEIRYGSEFLFTPGGQRIYSRVVGQDLLVWYGLQDRADFGQTTILTDSEWTFTVTGDHPVASVYTFLSYHSNTAGDMPDLLPLAYNHLYLLPDDTSQLDAETPSGSVQGKPLRSQSAQKLIVLIHGWNPQGCQNKFAPDNSGPLSGRWADLGAILAANPVVQQFGWQVARYDWARDAATGAGLSLWGTDNARASRDAASAHGAKLGQLIQNSGAVQVQFIAHSAGNWAARRAAAYLKQRNPAIQIQITSLDPFVTDDLQPAFELTSLWTDYRDNFYVVDPNPLSSGTDEFGWTSGDFSGWNNADIERLEAIYSATLYESWMKNHSGPISWYALTAQEANLGNSHLLEADAGFLTSLPIRIASAANDAFPGETLTSASGSTLWFNYQATTQPSEPTHNPSMLNHRSVWGRWTAPATGTVTFDTFGADFYNVLAIYTGSILATLTPVAQTTAGGKGPGECQITFTAVAGQVYYVAVDGLLWAAGQCPLRWQMTGGGTTPTVLLTAPAAGATVGNVTTVSATASGATKVEFLLDGVRQFSDAATPFTWAWNTATAANGSHTLSAKSYSGTVLLATSANRTVTVNNATTPPGNCVDANEPNDSSLTATPLAPGANLNSYICSATDVDWFQITVPSSGTLTLNLAVPALKDYELEIYGPDYAYLTGSYQDPGQAESVVVSVPSLGNYFARVCGYPAGNGSFSTSAAFTLSSSFDGVGTGVMTNFNYTARNGQITITKYTGTCEVAVIPSQFTGLPVTRIGDYAFAGSTNLSNVLIPIGVSSIGLLAFYQCPGLTNIALPASITGIGQQAFNQCSSLTSITLPPGLTSIGSLAFISCRSLTNVTIPTSVTTIGDGAFADCSSLTGIAVEASNPAYCSAGGVLFNKSQTMLKQFPGGKHGDYTVPQGVTQIADWSFSYCHLLTNVKLPYGLTNISNEAFHYCTSLTNVVIPASATSIGAAAFSGCTSLSGITIPTSVTSIGDAAFGYCAKLTGAYFDGGAPACADAAFTGASSTTVYHLPWPSGWGATYGGRPTANWLAAPWPVVAANRVIPTGSSASFSVGAAVPPPISYQWRFNGTAIPGATGSVHSISQAKLSNTGNYDVVVANALGGATSQVATLTVLVPPAVAITKPTAGHSYASPYGVVDIGGTAAAGSRALSQITWINNRGGSGTATGTTDWSVSNLALQSGTNGITVTVLDSAGITGTDTLTVVWAVYPTSGPDVVFSANRGGNWGIYRMDRDGSHEVNLTPNSIFDVDPACLPSGEIVFSSTRNSWANKLYRMNADGSNVRLIPAGATSPDGGYFFGPEVLRTPACSPDGSKIACVLTLFSGGPASTNQIWVLNTDGSNFHNVSNNAFDDSDPTFTPDGTKIVFRSSQSGNSDIFVMNVDGSNRVRLTTDPSDDWTPDVSPDGSMIVFDSERDGNSEVYTMRMDGSCRTNLSNNSGADGDTAFSPDGSQVIFVSDRDGNYELYSMPVSGSTPTQLTFTESPTMQLQPCYRTITTCSYVLSPADASLGAGYSSGSFGVTASTGCTWTASPDQEWLRTTSSGNGTGVVNFTVAANISTSARSGSIIVGNQLFTITQAGDPTPPVVTITSPTTNATYTTVGNMLNLTGGATDDVGVTLVTWSNDQGGSGTASGTINWAVTNLNLQSGVNVITVTAGDAAGNTSTDTLTVTLQPGWISHPAFGWLWSTATGWYGGNAYGWMWFHPGGQWIWTSSLQGWLAITDPTSRAVWSTQFRWLTPSATDAYQADTTAIGSIYVGKYQNTDITDGWVVSDRFGYVWANGDGIWFYSTTYGWLGVTADGGIWCVSENRFL